MRIVRTVPEVRSAVADARKAGHRIGLVPTMGYFHEGHLALMRRAREQAGFVVVSLFVNPTQFNDPGDLARYPRDEARDARLAEGTGAALLFAPEPAEIYPAGHATAVAVSGVTERLEGESRGPGHFRGVATVVAKLFNIVRPDLALFGQKDAQQALVIRRMARDLDFPLEIEVVPTVREPDGLAMSSRNSLLSPDARARAPLLAKALSAVRSAAENGERDPGRALEAGRAILAGGGIAPEYFEIVDAETLAPVSRLGGALLAVIAAPVGGIRLIDNAPFRVG